MVGVFGLFHFGVIVLEMVEVGLAGPSLFAIGTILCQASMMISDRAGYGWDDKP